MQFYRLCLWFVGMLVLICKEHGTFGNRLCYILHIIITWLLILIECRLFWDHEASILGDANSMFRVARCSYTKWLYMIGMHLLMLCQYMLAHVRFLLSMSLWHLTCKEIEAYCLLVFDELEWVIVGSTSKLVCIALRL